MENRQSFPTWRDSAQETFTKWQVATLLLLVILLASGIALSGASLTQVLTLANSLMTILYFTSLCYSFSIILASMPTVDDAWEGEEKIVIAKPPGVITFTPEELESIDERSLPIVTILLPMFNEGDLNGENNVVRPLIKHLQLLDYPKEKIDIIFLLEEEDEATIAAVKRQLTSLNAWNVSRIEIVPQGEPQTKPRACNYGLSLARGELLVIFDAEDEPDPKQLKKAFLAFGKASPSTVCVQAMLEYKNPNTNILTASFTIEYWTHFWMTLPGFSRLGLPVPLGGTSNYFRTEFLRKIGGWDAYNVTEDYELTHAIAGEKGNIAMMDSFTREEATSKIKSWIKQRSRWTKGRQVTFFVSMQHPFRFARRLGPKKFFSFAMEAGVVPILSLVSPIYWAMMGIYIVTGAKLIDKIYPQPIYYLGLVSLIGGWTGFLAIVLLAAQKRELYKVALIAFLSKPAYSILQSLGQIMGTYELIAKPHYWHKTTHGLDANLNARHTLSLDEANIDG
ncbi:MAG TPA: glycosyltransferase [Patescibacteria group bacterium]|nr:glycosyltransferase [Patescibacteria group bacterium]